MGRHIWLKSMNTFDSNTRDVKELFSIGNYIYPICGAEIVYLNEKDIYIPPCKAAGD